jgi:ADP-L-glycero-D-manno-heptose 6-epimerase
MIVITGAAGFIGSALTGHLLEAGYQRLMVVDDFSRIEKAGNLAGKENLELKDRQEFPEWFDKYGSQVEVVFHLGARTDTAETDEGLLKELNTEYSKKLWAACVKHKTPFYYASSAATYGDGSNGFSDDESIIPDLQPLNPYGWSKQQFDLWALKQTEEPPSWAGFKFFNVYGPNEYHKGRMASVIFHAFHQIQESGKMKLFRSHNPEFKDGEQKRDFIYIKDVLKVLEWFYENETENAIYNLGTGQARTFLDLTRSTFDAMDKEPEIEFIDTPKDIRENYQYFTEAEMEKLRNQAYDQNFTSLEEGINDYVRNYLFQHAYI